MATQVARHQFFTAVSNIADMSALFQAVDANPNSAVWIQFYSGAYVTFGDDLSDLAQATFGWTNDQMLELFRLAAGVPDNRVNSVQINAKDILDRATRILLDETSIRWPLAELRLWLNDAIREIAVLKPTAYSHSIIVPLDVGTLQYIPAGYSSVMRIVRNLKTEDETPRQGGDAIRTVDLQMLDISSPSYGDFTKVRFRKAVKNVAFDANDPRAFYVFPGNDGTGVVEAIAAKIPEYVPQPPINKDTIAAYDYEIDLQPIYHGALLDFVLYRAYSKESSFAGSVERAAAYYGAFASALGATTALESMRNPNTKPATTQENAA